MLDQGGFSLCWSVTILWPPCRCMAVGWGGRLSVICKQSYLGGFGGGDCRSGGIVSFSAHPWRGWLYARGHSWSRITRQSLSEGSCISCLPSGCSALSLAITDTSAPSVDSTASLSIRLAGLCTRGVCWAV